MAGANVDPLTTVFGELSVVTSTAAGFLAAGADSLMTVRYQPQDGLADSVLVTLVPEDATVPGATLTINAAAPSNSPPVLLQYPGQRSSPQAGPGSPSTDVARMQPRGNISKSRRTRFGMPGYVGRRAGPCDSAYQSLS